jgi:ABC-type sugar transport system ATPase subunit
MEVKQPILETRGLSKRFGFVEAVKNVNWQVFPGQVTALVGDNGAGKSTLIKLICGAYLLDAGEIWVHGKRAHISGPVDAFKLGIAPVYQSLELVENRNVMLNMYLGNELTRGPLNVFLDKKRMYDESLRVLGEIHARIPDVREPVAKLSGGQRQVVAVGRALVRGGEIIILDEPTAALGVEQTQEVLRLIETLRSNGKTVILISHNLSQVMEISDWISVMFHGEMVGSRRKDQVSRSDVVSMIMGTKADDLAMA